MKNKIIHLSDGKIELLATAFQTTKERVVDALNGKIDNELSERIREVAIIASSVTMEEIVPFEDWKMGGLAILLNVHTDTITDVIFGKSDTELSKQIREITKTVNEVSSKNHLSQFRKEKRK